MRKLLVSITILLTLISFASCKSEEEKLLEESIGLQNYIVDEIFDNFSSEDKLFLGEDIEELKDLINAAKTQEEADEAGESVAGYLFISAFVLDEDTLTEIITKAVRKYPDAGERYLSDLM